MPIVKMPDGTQVRFPDEMPKEQIRDMILRKFPDAGTAAPAQQTPAEGGEQPSSAFTDALAQIRARAPGAANPELAKAGLPSIDQHAPGANGQVPANFGGANARGMLTPGNTDLSQRPIVKNDDGSISTVRSMSFENNNGQEVLIPTVADDGSRILSNQEAMEQYGRTGKHLGIFDNPDDATAYAESLHNDQEKQYQPRAELSALTTGFQKAPQEDTDRLVRANLEASKIQEMQGDKGLLRRAAEAIPGGATGGFADEIYSGTVGGLSRMARDGVGYGEAYKREQALAAAQKRKRGDAANIIGDVAGGLATGGTLAKGGLTLTGRATSGLGKVAAAAGEGAAYGGVYGAGNAEEGKRLEEAGTGALLGAATGLGAEVLGSGISRLASKAKQPTTVAPTIDELTQATDDFYARSRAAGVTIKQPSFDKLANNMQLAAGRLNEKLRPGTAGIVEDVMALKGRNITLEELDDLRQQVGDAMSGAKRQDIRTLTRMKTVLDHFADNVKSGDITGDIRGFDLIKEGRKLASRKAKAETIETIVENAKNSASGFENGVINEFRSLARNPKRMGKFSKEEQKMIKGIIRRANVHGGLRAIGYLSPKSPLGAAVLGAMGIGSGIVPAAMVAGTGMASRAAATALTRGKLGNLQSAVANGSIPQLPQLPNYLRPAIGGLTAGTTGLALPRSAR